MTFGLSKEGFNRKNLSDIKTEIENALKAQFGNDIDLRSESVFGQIVGVLSLPISEQWAELENLWLAFDPDYAEGVSLDSLCALSGITRQPATNTTVQALLYGTEGTVVTAGSEVINSTTEDVYTLDSAVTITKGAVNEAQIVVNTVANSTAYTITIDGTDYSITSDSDATEEEILLAIDTALAAVDEFVEVTDDGIIKLYKENLDEPFTLSVTANLTIGLIGSPANFTAAESGAIFVPAGSLDEIQTSISGWEAVSNPSDGTVGVNEETDTELRFRRRQSVSFPAIATVDSILANLLQLDEVQAAKVYENNTDATDANSVPAHHIWAIVKGGDDEDIAEVIYKTKAGGIGTHGDTTTDYTSESGQQYSIKFERPTELDLYVDMTIVPTTGYSADAPQNIKDAIAAWVAANVSIGDELRYSRLFTPINSIKGFEVTELFIGTSASPTGEVSLTAGIDEIITSDTANISITVDE